jgi:Acyl-protein synthetase, LuxE
MKTARKTTRLSALKSPPAGELDARILDFITRGVDRRSTDAEFNALALALFGHQFSLNRPYRRYCESAGCGPRSVTHWTQIPAVPTTAFKDAELTTLRPRERAAVFHSSGTTEHRPSRHFHSKATRALYEAALWPMFQSRMGIPPDPLSSVDRQDACPMLIILTPTPSEAPHSSLVHMMETVRRRLSAPRSAFVGDAKLEDGRALVKAVQSKIQSRVRETNEVNPKPKILLLGTAIAFVRLLDAIQVLPLPPGARVMETGGYKGRTREVPREELHAQMAAKLDVARSAIVSEYGMCELSSQFYTRPTLHASRAAVFTGPPWTRVQVINPETGREAREGGRGLVRIFDLANRGSVLAVQTEDVGVRRGDGFELLGRAPQAEARGCSLLTPS